MTALATHVLARPGVRWSDVARRVDGQWFSDHPVAQAAMRSPFLNQVAAEIGWEAIPVPPPGPFLTQLRILNCGDKTAHAESRERVLFELYEIPTHMIWSMEAR